MKELEIGELIESGYLVSIFVDGKEYKSRVTKTDGSYITLCFKRIKVTIPRVYTTQIREPDEYGVYFRVYKE